MDPPQEGDDAPSAIHGMNGLALMEQLGLGEGTRVIDLQVRLLSLHLADGRTICLRG